MSVLSKLRFGTWTENLVFVLAATLFFVGITESEARADWNALANALENGMLPTARCLVGAPKARDATFYLLSFPGALPKKDEKGKKALKAIAGSGCLALLPKENTALNLWVMRSPFFQVVYDSEFGSSEPSDLSKLAVLNFSAEFSGDESKKIGFLVSRRVSDCVARGNARGVHALLAAEFNSDEEALRWKALQPMSDCVDSEPNFHLSKWQVRGAFAEALFRLRNAQEATETGVTPNA
jgi:hypothetical protein